MDPITVTDMKRRKSAARKTRADYTPPAPAPLNPDAVCQLRNHLLNATVGYGCEVPAVHALSADRFTSTANEAASSSAPVTELPDVTDMLSPHLAYCFEIEVSNCPLPVAFLQHAVFESTKCVGFEEEKQRFISSVSYSAADRAQILDITRGQSQNVEWYNQRMGSLTASNFGPILRFMSSRRSKADGLIRRIQNYRQRGLTTVPSTNVPSLKWGLSYESVALKSYQSVATSLHSNLTIRTSGLCVSVTDPYLRASPDAIASCSCHQEQRLVEIKCPWTARNIDPADAIDAGIIKYVRKVSDAYSLIPGGVSGYYEQVQGTMAVTGLSHCDFVIWTMHGILVVPMDFDVEFWEHAKCKLRNFFEKFVVAEILTERIWRTLPLFDDDAVDDDDVERADSSVSLVQEFGGDIVLEDDRQEENFLSHGFESECSGASLNDTATCETDNYCDYQDMQSVFFDFDDFDMEEIIIIIIIRAFVRRTMSASELNLRRLKLKSETVNT